MSDNDKYYEYGIARNAVRVWEGPGPEPRCECGHLWQHHDETACWLWYRGDGKSFTGGHLNCPCTGFVTEKQHIPGRYARKHVKMAEERRVWWEAEKLKRRAEWQADIEAEIADLKGEK